VCEFIPYALHAALNGSLAQWSEQEMHLDRQDGKAVQQILSLVPITEENVHQDPGILGFREDHTPLRSRKGERIRRHDGTRIRRGQRLRL
jgi:hypothetical protein